MRIKNLESILTALRMNKEKYYAEFGVTRMGVFGSFTRAEQTSASDIDIVIEMKKDKKNIHNFLNFKRLLEKEFGCKVDIGFENTLKPAVRENLKGKVIYA